MEKDVVKSGSFSEMSVVPPLSTIILVMEASVAAVASERLEQVAGATPAGDPAGDDPAETELLHRALAMIRGEFEARTWAAFWQTAVEGRAAADVAADLGMTPGAVRVAKSRVLHRLRTDLRDLLG